MYPTRRALLKTVSAAGVAGLAGCMADDGNGGGDTGDDGGGGSSPTPTATATATESPTEPSPTPTATETAPTVAVGTHPTYGEVLVDGDGHALYLFTPDMAENSVCYDQCAENWPPLTVEGEPTAGDGVEATLTTFERDDGATQVAAEGQPLYYFVADESPGDANGQEVVNVWFLLRPDGSGIKPSVSVREHDDLGPILTDADGMTLYLFTNDEEGTSNCTEGCADAWPPLPVGDRGLVESVRTDVELGTIDHPEEGPMVTAAGHPLYYYAQDEEPGDATGQGVGDVWYVLDDEGNPVGM